MNVQSHNGVYGALHIVVGGLGQVRDLNWEHAAFERDDSGIVLCAICAVDVCVKVVEKGFSVNGGG